MSGVNVGAGAIVRRAIIDKWVKIPPGMQIGVDPEEDRKHFKVTDSGIVAVPRGYDFHTRTAADDRRIPSDSDCAGV